MSDPFRLWEKEVLSLGSNLSDFSLTGFIESMFSETVTFSVLYFVCVGSPFFRDDTRLRALRFLDHMLVWLNFYIGGDML